MHAQKLKSFSAFFVIENNRPLTPGHLLVVSKAHIRALDEVSAHDWRSYYEAVQFALRHITETYHKDAFSFINAPSGQSVLHFHQHFVPNYFSAHGIDARLRQS